MITKKNKQHTMVGLFFHFWGEEGVVIFEG